MPRAHGRGLGRGHVHVGQPPPGRQSRSQEEEQNGPKKKDFSTLHSNTILNGMCTIPVLVSICPPKRDFDDTKELYFNISRLQPLNGTRLGTESSAIVLFLTLTIYVDTFKSIMRTTNYSQLSMSCI